jgi:hypothetical protein
VHSSFDKRVHGDAVDLPCSCHGQDIHLGFFLEPNLAKIRNGPHLRRELGTTVSVYWKCAWARPNVQEKLAVPENQDHQLAVK